MSEYRQFQKKSRIISEDESHHKKILKAITTYNEKVEGMKLSQFRNWQDARQQAGHIRDYALQNLPQLLENFEKKITSRGATVIWAQTARETRSYLLTIIQEHKVKKIIKSKSMLTEEIDFNEFCEKQGLEVLESDLGELIVQLAGEKPYHIVTPAMHKSRREIAQIFHEKLGIPFTENVSELTNAARHYLRKSFVEADMGVTGANFLVADEGAVSIVENEGNGRLTMACPPVHVVIAGIEKILPRLADLSLFLPLLATSGTGQHLTCYNTLIRGPKQPGEPDGPEHLYIILLDNERSTLYANKKMREALQCIRCGACLNVCPVYQTVGGHTYHTTYQGPIGAVITPHLKKMKEWNHLTYASSLCGACTDACPVNINLHHLLLENRYLAYSKKLTGHSWSFGLKGWAQVFTSRKRLNFMHKVIQIFEPLIKIVLPPGKRKRMPPIPKKSFAEIWNEK
jgi:L-lactate dehydrogenase complex protein LldF